MTISLQDALQRTIEHREIFHDEMLSIMRRIMSGEVSPVMIAALTVGLRVKKETIGEIAAAAQVMREFSTKVDVADREHLLDIVGTGGDASHTFNISTASMFVAGAAGARVAKHGNRSVSSRSGSADVLESLGANIMLKPEAVATCIAETGVGFMFAPNHHTAMKYAAPVRKELGVRTIFNILGPLTNPAGAANQLVGVFHPDLVGIHVRVLQRLGARHALVVYGRDGMDEVSLGAATLVGELKDGQIREYEIHPEDFGMQMVSNRSLKVENADESKTMLLGALSNEPGTAREIVALNAGTALYSANVVDSIAEALNQHKKSLKGAKLLVLGVAYKKDVDDLRESPTLKIMEILQKRGAEFDYNDPYFPHLHKMRHYDYSHLKSVPLGGDMLGKYDAVIIATDHSSYDYASIVDAAKLVVDTRNATRRVIRNRHKIYPC